MIDGTLIILIFSAIAFLAIIAYIFAYKPVKKSYEGFAVPVVKEKFIVPVGAGLPDCGRSLPELANIIEKISNINSEDSREFIVLSGKLACAKTDLLSTAQLVQASINQPFMTTHDLQPITETISQCFNKAIPARDLKMIFDLYRERGIELIKRIGAICGGDAANKFNKSVTEVYNIARERCAPVVQSEGALLPGFTEMSDFAEYVLGGAAL